MPRPMTLVVMSNRETNYSPQTLLLVSGGGIGMGKTDSLSSLDKSMKVMINSTGDKYPHLATVSHHISHSKSGLLKQTDL